MDKMTKVVFAGMILVGSSAGCSDPDLDTGTQAQALRAEPASTVIPLPGPSPHGDWTRVCSPPSCYRRSLTCEAERYDELAAAFAFAHSIAMRDARMDEDYELVNCVRTGTGIRERVTCKRDQPGYLGVALQRENPGRGIQRCGRSCRALESALYLINRDPLHAERLAQALVAQIAFYKDHGKTLVMIDEQPLVVELTQCFPEGARAIMKSWMMRSTPPYGAVDACQAIEHHFIMARGNHESPLENPALVVECNARGLGSITLDPRTWDLEGDFGMFDQSWFVHWVKDDPFGNVDRVGERCRTSTGVCNELTAGCVGIDCGNGWCSYCARP